MGSWSTKKHKHRVKQAITNNGINSLLENLLHNTEIIPYTTNIWNKA